MAINTALLVASPTLQDVIVDDATGLPLANGQIFLYQDNSRTTFKNWYYQSGAPGAYTYITLPNPLTLNAAGAISDPNGNDTIPFFYPFSEADNVTPQPYYIQVFNQNGQQKFVRQNFPFNPDIPVPETISTLKNYIVNNGFWRNAGSINTATLPINPLNGLASVVVAPGANDGFSMPDIIYSKNANGATETITFTKFANGSFFTPIGANPPNQDVTPEYYLNLNVTAAGTETSRYIQIPVQLHVKNLESTQVVFTIWALNGTGNPNNTITVNLLQFLGTGVASPTASTLKTLTLTSSWTKFEIPFTFPSVAAGVGSGQDDAWYIQIAFPAGVGITTNINIAKPSLYIGNDVPTNDFTSYNDVTPIIDGFRTGDVRTSLNSFQPFGWVAMNDGTICQANPNSTPNVVRANADTWPLYNLLWNSFKAYDSGSNSNQIAQMYTNAATPTATNYGATAYADFTANKQLALTKMMGRVILGTVPTSLMTKLYNDTCAGSNSGGNLLLTTTDTTNFYNGMPVTFSGGTLPDALVTTAVYFVVNFNSGAKTFNVATTFSNAMAGIIVAYGSTNGSGFSVVSSIAGSTGGEYAHTQLTAELASHSHSLASGESFVTSVGTTLNKAGASAGFDTASSTNTTGSSTPFNIVQPDVYMNFYIKL